MLAVHRLARRRSSPLAKVWLGELVEPNARFCERTADRGDVLFLERRVDVEMHGARLRERKQAGSGRLERSDDHLSLAEPEAPCRRSGDLCRERSDPHANPVSERDE